MYIAGQKKYLSVLVFLKEVPLMLKRNCSIILGDLKVNNCRNYRKV